VLPGRLPAADDQRGATFPTGAGVAYSHAVVLSGTAPITIASMTLPTWMEAVLDAGVIRFTGIPPAAGAYMVTVVLKGCGVLTDAVQACIYVVANEGGGGD
jgi:hypothetical protein